jgi:cellulose synthase/poly-beta-1,6-N-acetylglucosamine synthase-like glycosyltransferase
VSTPAIAVVVPCSESHANVMGACLDSLLRQDLNKPYDIIVINSDNSTAVSKVLAAYDCLEVIGTDQCNSAGAARNLGVAATNSPYIAFTDADCVVSSAWLRIALGVLEDGAVAVGGAVSNLRPWHPLATMDNLLQFIDQSPNRPEGKATAYPGCNFAIDKIVFVSLGGFPTDMPVGEDTLLTNAVARLHPQKTLFNAGMSVQHLGRTGLGEYWRHQQGFGFWRGVHGLHLTLRHQKLGRNPVVALAAGGRRWFYLCEKTSRWYPLALPRFLLYSPFLFVGLLAWSIGFYHGCRKAVVNQ